MLIELYGQNFGCFRDEFRLSMLATSIDEGNERGLVSVDIEGDPEPLLLLRCAAIYGPNASGKSTVLEAAAALSAMLGSSARGASDEAIEAYEPFALDEQHRSAPTVLGLRAVVAGVVYEYRIKFDRQRVIQEALSKHAPDTDRMLLDRHEATVQGDWTGDQQFSLIASAFRPNALLLSLADSLAPSVAGKIVAGLRRSLTRFRIPESRGFPLTARTEPVARRVVDDPAFAEWLRPRLRDIDVGVVDYDTEEVPAQPTLFETDGGASRKRHRLALFHDGENGPTRLPIWRESHGTRRFLEFSPMLYEISRGADHRAFLVDEFDASMHPVLVKALIHHFNCELPRRDVRGQIVFTAHNTDLMEGEARDAVLRRDQVYFTEKGSDGAARLFSLAEFNERNNLNIRRRYLQGRYGALPSLGDFSE